MQISYPASFEGLVGATERLRSRLQIGARLQISAWSAEQFGLVVRWGVAIAGALGGWVESTDERATLKTATVLAVFGYTLLRSFLRVRPRSRPGAAVVSVLADVTAYGTAAYFTGTWSSPYIVCVAGAVALGGMMGGLVPVLVGLGEVITYRVVRMSVGTAVVGTGPASYKIVGILAMGALGACAGELMKMQKQRAGEILSLRSVNEMHSLLIELHARAAGESSSLTLKGAIEMVVAKIRDEIPADLVALLLRDTSVDGTDQQWQVATAEGLQLPPMLGEKRLPEIARMTERQRETLRWANAAPGQGLDPHSKTGLYAPLWGRSAPIGVLVLERHETQFSDSDAEVVDGIAQYAGLAIENTRWFARLRQLGAEAERDRIARELHDRIGQSLAGVGLAVDRLAMTLPPEVVEVKDELESLAADVRGVTRQVREKLTDLRTGPSSAASLDTILGDFVERVGTRSNLHVVYDHRPVKGLTEAEQHEVWRIAQEAILNAERHANAKSLRVFWAEHFGSPLLIVRDDGKGIAGSSPIRRDAYGLIGMRERAEGIGASLRIDTAPGSGTIVRLRLKRCKR